MLPCFSKKSCGRCGSGRPEEALDPTQAPAALTGSVALALRICAGLCVVGAAISWLTISHEALTRRVQPADLLLPCYDPCTESSAA